MTTAGDAWLAECWSLCRELSRAERMAQREADEVARAMADDLFTQAVDRGGETVERRAS